MRSSLKKASSESEVSTLFGNALDDIPPQHRRRLDLFRKLVQEVRTLDTQVAKWLAYAVVGRANQYPYDQFLGPGFVAIEAQKLVIAAVERVGDPEGQEVLDRSIRVASHDRFALSLLEQVEGRRGTTLSASVTENLPALNQAFVERMQLRYNGSSPQSARDISNSDWYAFRRWVETSAKDQEIARNFLTDFIVCSRKKLGQAINFVYPNGFWESDPRPIVDRFFPTSEFNRLIGELPDDGDLEDVEKDGLERMKGLLVGNYPTGPGGTMQSAWKPRNHAKST